MENEKKLAMELIDFLHNSPTAFQAIETVKNTLFNNGFAELKEYKKWRIESRGKYFTVKNNSAIIAFVVGDNKPNEDGFRIIGAHTDSPGFRIKPNPEIITENSYIKLNTEVYGGPILNTWMDRPLSIAGRVVLRGNNPLKPLSKLIDFKNPIITIPNLAIHMNRNVNQGVELNKQADVLPIISLVNDTFEKDNYFIKLLAKKLKAPISEILDFDLFLYETQKGTLVGLNEEFISAGRIDDLSMVHVGIKALIESEDNKTIKVMACFDNEEVGSASKQGADSTLLSNTLERISLSFNEGKEEYLIALAKSFLISADGAHAVHPNKGEKGDPTNRPLINKGPVIKISSNQRYTSDGDSASVFKEICRSANVPYQIFVNRSDEVGGSTIGPISSTHLNIRSVDIGSPMLAMHSIRELCGVLDHSFTLKAFKEFYKL